MASVAHRARFVSSQCMAMRPISLESGLEGFLTISICDFRMFANALLKVIGVHSLELN